MGILPTASLALLSCAFGDISLVCVCVSGMDDAGTYSINKQVFLVEAGTAQKILKKEIKDFTSLISIFTLLGGKVPCALENTFKIGFITVRLCH